MGNKIIDDLIACGVPSDTLLAVVKLIAEAEITERNRTKTRERVQRFRGRKRDVTLRNVTETLPPPAYTTPPRVSEPKKVPRHRRSMPADFALTEADVEYATSRGWPRAYVESEFVRFCDHAKANDRKQADWHAAWRNWVTSPYQKTGGHNGKTTVHAANPHGKTAADVARELLQECRDEQSEFSDRLFPQIGRG